MNSILKNRNILLVLFAIIFLFLFFFAFGFGIYSVLLGILFLIFIVTFIFILNRYSQDIRKVEELNQKLSENDYAFSPVFSSKTFIDLGKNIDNLKGKISLSKQDISSMDKMKEDFIYLVSHNLRTPIVTLFGYLDILNSSKNLSEDDKNILLRIHTSLTDLNKIVEQTLSLVYLESPDFKLNIERFNLNSFVKDTIEDSAKGKDVSLGFSLSDDIGEVESDKSIIEKSIVNIIDNSLKFNHQGGLISTATYKEGNFYVIKISDTGIGISQKDIEDIFKPFVRKTSVLDYNYEGLGLGLYTVKVALDKIKGDIKVNSIPNKGSDFLIYIPEKIR
jgi:signal transduction histidine kinase